MKSPNLIQKARDLWNRKEDQRRAAANKEADQCREEETRRDRQRKYERALEHQLENEEYNPDLDGPTVDETPELVPRHAPTQRELSTAGNATAMARELGPSAPNAEQKPQGAPRDVGLPPYDMEPLIPLSDEEIAKLKFIEAEDPLGRSMRAQFDPRTVIALREQGEAAPALDSHETGHAPTQRGLSTASNAGGRDAPRQDPDPEDDLEPDDELEM